MVLVENGDYCQVVKVGMRTTKLYNAFDHDLIIIPNSKIANEKVINLTEPDNTIEIRVVVSVAYDAGIEKTKKTMLEVAISNSDIINDEDRQTFVRLQEFSDSAVILKMYTWGNHLDNQWRLGSEIRENILTRFKEEDIVIPYLQRVVHHPAHVPHDDGGYIIPYLQRAVHH